MVILSLVSKAFYSPIVYESRGLGRQLNWDNCLFAGRADHDKVAHHMETRQV